MVSLTSYPWGLLGGPIRYCYGESLATGRCCGHCRVHLEVIFFIWIKSMWRWPHALRCMNVHHNWMMIAMYSVVARQTVGQLFWPSFFNVSNHMDSIHQIGGELRYIKKKKKIKLEVNCHPPHDVSSHSSPCELAWVWVDPTATGCTHAVLIWDSISPMNCSCEPTCNNQFE